MSTDKTQNKQINRLYSRGVFLGYQRNRESQHLRTCLIKIEGVNTKKDTEYYLGKRVAYVYRAKNHKTGGNYRVIWGRVRRPHGNAGVVRASFNPTLPPCAMGKRVRVMLYPSRV